MNSNISNFSAQYVFAVSIVALPIGAFAGEADCGSLKNHFGPFDYRSAPPEQRQLVEGTHFTPKVETLVGGNTTISPGGDMGYTLNVFPNHHRALMALIKLSEKEKTDKPRDMGYTVACRFERAERFRPDDATVKMLHGIYLMRKGKMQAAADKLEEANSLAGEDANILYNLGLAYFDLKQFDKALASAHAAYALGFPLPGLRDKLKRAGKWTDAPPVTVNQSKTPETPSTKEDPAGNPPSSSIIQPPEAHSAKSSPVN